MSKPIEAGCLARVVDGLRGKDSPNIGLVVKVLHYVGDHTAHGRIWRCEADAERGQGGHATTTREAATPGQADFAQSWLQRIDPPPVRHAANDHMELQA